MEIPMTGFERISLLLLEDDIDDYGLIARQLKNEKCEFVVEWAHDLALAIEKLQSGSYDVIISDLHLPDSAGLATISELRLQCEQTPIIVLTSMEDDRIERNIMEVKAQDYLVKGELGGRAIARAVLNVVQRHKAMKDITDLVLDQQRNQQMLKEQAELLKKKNLHLEQLNRTAQEFVDNVSHDFRTPLTVIKDYASIISEGMVGDINDEQRRMLDKVSVRVDDLNIMVDDLLDVSKLESGLLGAWRRDCSMQEIIERLESMLQQRAQVKNVQFEVEIEDNLPEVYCDSDKAGRVITNLAVNAIKFAGDGGQVKLWAKADTMNNQILVGVTDNGPGIDEDSLEQIFQRFKQLRSGESTTKGFGLGLSIAQRLCRLNLGSLMVESQLGEGSTFKFSVPVLNHREIVTRWLSNKDIEFEMVQVIEVEVDNDLTLTDCNELDKFLNCQLRRDDLLFRVDDHTWWIVMAVPQNESQMWFTRAEKEFNKTNRNRPIGPLPNYKANVRSQWGVGEPTEDLLQSFELLVEETYGVEAMV